jgi:thiol-disulfide isomerase/thioredoxin
MWFNLKSLSPGALRRSAALIVFPLLFFGCLAPVMGPEDVVWSRPEDRQPVDLSGTLKTLDQQNVSLSDLDNKVLFLNFWATWCAPCLAEMPSMASLHNQLSEKGLGIVALSDEDPQTVRRFLDTHPYPFDVWLDSESLFVQRFQVYAYPTTLVVDSQGRLVARQMGAQQWDTPTMIDRFRQLLDDHQP